MLQSKLSTKFNIFFRGRRSTATLNEAVNDVDDEEEVNSDSSSNEDDWDNENDSAILDFDEPRSIVDTVINDAYMKVHILFM